MFIRLTKSNNQHAYGPTKHTGMMTGQILGGSPVVEAARYQMLIMYLMATCTFGSILMELRIVLIVAFDSKNQMLFKESNVASRSFY
mmetsp:Transcript_43599/g.44113  ORF Transcript_43599/g.44113 Transcript_43599/m.44113 type:complete len:87 (+) Transcript_43599:899-1159(+)